MLFLPSYLFPFSAEGEICTFRPGAEHLREVSYFNASPQPGDTLHLDGCTSWAWLTLFGGIDKSYPTAECVMDLSDPNFPQAYWNTSQLHSDLCLGKLIYDLYMTSFTHVFGVMDTVP